MRVLLDDQDIQKALTNYVSTLGLANSTGVKITTADGELTAEVMFNPITDESPTEADVTETPKKRGRGGRPRGSKNLPKTDTKGDADVGTPVQAGAADSSAGDSDAPEGETPPTPAETVDEPKPKGTAKGNLFGDAATPSSEDEDGGQAEDAPAVSPEPVAEPKAKKGSIFDA